MEVHAHSHAHGKKNWRSYFWEFFMLFLAVFAGFLAENQREHYVEHQREKQYMRSLLADIRSDTAQLHPLIDYAKLQTKYNDSFLIDLMNPLTVQNANNAYFFWQQSNFYPPFVYNDRTIQQLKNSSGLRLIRNKEVSDSIMNYDGIVRWLINTQQNLTSYLSNYEEYSFKLFSTLSHSKDLGPESQHDYFERLYLIRNSNKPIGLLNTDQKFIEEVYGYRTHFKFLQDDLVKNQQKTVDAGARLISLIKQEYHLK